MTHVCQLFEACNTVLLTVSCSRGVKSDKSRIAVPLYAMRGPAFYSCMGGQDWGHYFGDCLKHLCVQAGGCSYNASVQLQITALGKVEALSTRIGHQPAPTGGGGEG
jgi:hypothetical protein